MYLSLCISNTFQSAKEENFTGKDRENHELWDHVVCQVDSSRSTPWAMMRCRQVIRGYLPGECSEGGGGESRERKGKKPNNCKSSPIHSLITQETLDVQIIPKLLSYLMVKELSLARWLVSLGKLMSQAAWAAVTKYCRGRKWQIFISSCSGGWEVLRLRDGGRFSSW